MEYTILDYIPQRPPFVMVDEIESCTLELCRTRFRIVDTNPLVDNGLLLESGVIENIAQSCAARIGYVNIHIKKQKVRIGVIGGIKDFKLSYRPKVGEVLTTEISDVLSDFGDMSILNATTYCNGQQIASCEIKVALV